jgi:hypothetical protein
LAGLDFICPGQSRLASHAQDIFHLPRATNLIAGLFLLPFQILEHGYYWLGPMIIVNGIFTISGLVSVCKDISR